MSKPIAPALLQWFNLAGRKNLPWQSTPPNIYYVWVSEVMLQQTTVATVMNYFDRFISRFPTLRSLAESDLDDVLLLWSGLGYYARARNLHRSAQIIFDQHDGHFPQDLEEVKALPGIGESTAAAIISTVFNQPHAILDGNVKRVLSRYHCVEGHSGQSAYLKTLWQLARVHTPTEHNADYTQAIMDLGALVCRRKNPLCHQCPLQSGCQAALTQTTTNYPQPKPRTSKPVRSIAMLVICNHAGEVYLQQRPPQGIWGGLWSLPECDPTPKAIKATVASFDSNANIQKRLDPFRHSFTHYHLQILPVVVLSYQTDHTFHTIDQLNVGIPTPVRRIFSAMSARQKPPTTPANR